MAERAADEEREDQPGPIPVVIAPGAIARGLIRGADRATLATSLARDGAIWPYASLVMIASAPDATPLLLISDLAQHTKNIERDVHVSLLFDGTGGLDEPLTGPRLTLVGRARETHDAADKARFLRRHPSAEPYSSFHDFRYYRVEPLRGHLVAGFGRIHWVEARDILYDGGAARSLAAIESEILDHMNRDHGEAVTLYAQRLLGLEGTGWVLTGIDPEGIDLRRGGKIGRLSFEAPVKGADGARAALVAMAHAARAKG
jgi:putative heme iron utilization protein